MSTHDKPLFPPADTGRLAELHDMVASVGPNLYVRGDSGDEAHIPAEVHEVIRRAVVMMRAGQAVTVEPVNLILTTQEAANFLGISRPSVVKLLDDGFIAHEKPLAGRHRRIQLTDLLDYRARTRRERTEALRELVTDAEYEGLHTEPAAETYFEALESIRQSRQTK
jgi:excisionase family DNA binding protein